MLHNLANDIVYLDCVNYLLSDLSITAARDTERGVGWERFEFNKDAPLDDEEIEGMVCLIVLFMNIMNYEYIYISVRFLSLFHSECIHFNPL